MAANFLHGVETIIVKKGARQVRGVKTAVVGLVGTAPIHLLKPENQTINKNMLVLNDRDAANYTGSLTDAAGYTLPQALRAIFAQGKGIVLAINVFDPNTHRTLGSAIATSGSHSLTGNVATVTTGAAHGLMVGDFVNIASFATPLAPLNQSYVAVKAVPTATTFTFGLTNADVAPTASAVGVVKKITFDPSLVTTADVIGAVTVSGDRTGMQAWKDAMSLFGFYPKVLIAPTYSTQATVSTEMDVLAYSLNAMAVIDAPAGTTMAQAIAGRGPAGAINFNTSSKRTILCYPHVEVFEQSLNAVVLEPLSQWAAGCITAKDVEEGYWVSPSNTEIKGIVGVERKLTAALDDPNSEVNILNEVGIQTVFNDFGSGLRLWGNRSAAFPTNTDPENFIPVQRTIDIVHESIRYAMRPFLDRPLLPALIDSIVETVNLYLRTLQNNGAIVDGKCFFTPDKNPITELSAGHLLLDLEFMPPTPAERITFESFINIELLKALYKAA